MLADTLGDELKLATQGQARVFAVSLKDRAAVLPGGFAADAAYWIEPKSGAWITSTYYRSDLPKWAQDFNSGNRAAKYWDRDWKNNNGDILRSTAHRKSKDGSDAGFYEVIGSTPFANEYELEFAKQLVVYEGLGGGRATDLLSISLSANDILGHQVGPDSPEMAAMALALDRELADFFNFLGHQIGLANVWIALSADHGVSALPDAAKKLRIPAANLDAGKLEVQINGALTAKFSPGHAATYIKLDYPIAWLDQDAFVAAHIKEQEAETAVGEAMKQAGLRALFHQVAIARRRSSRHCSRQEVFEQLFSRRRLVCNGGSGALYGRPGKRYGPRVALYLRYPRSIGFLRASISAWHLSNTFGASRYGDDIGIAARHQRSHSCRWPSAN